MDDFTENPVGIGNAFARGEAQNLEAFTGEDLVAQCVVAVLLGFQMLIAVDLDIEAVCETDKVEDVASER